MACSVFRQSTTRGVTPIGTRILLVCFAWEDCSLFFNLHIGEGRCVLKHFPGNLRRFGAFILKLVPACMLEHQAVIAHESIPRVKLHSNGCSGSTFTSRGLFPVGIGSVLKHRVGACSFFYKMCHFLCCWCFQKQLLTDFCDFCKPTKCQSCFFCVFKP